MQYQKTAQEMAEQNAKAQMDAVKQSFIQKARVEALQTAKYMVFRDSNEIIARAGVVNINEIKEYNLLEEAEKIYQWLIKVPTDDK